MKFIITESQYSLLTENSLSNWVRRRISKEFLQDLIFQGELEYPTLCSDFYDEHEYADKVIEWVVDELLSQFPSSDYFNEPDYTDVKDFLTKTLIQLFYQYLIKIWLDTCWNE